MYQAFLFKTTINLDLRRRDEQCIKSVIHQLNILWKTENIYHSWKDVFFIWKNYSVESVFIIKEKESKLIYPMLPQYQVSEWYILWPLINMYRGGVYIIHIMNDKVCIKYTKWFDTEHNLQKIISLKLPTNMHIYTIILND